MANYGSFHEQRAKIMHSATGFQPMSLLVVEKLLRYSQFCQPVQKLGGQGVSR